MHTVLVIDDEAGIRTALKDILEDERYVVSTAEDAVYGLEALSRESADLVMLDIWLPRMGGIDALKEIKSKWPDTEVIVISGHATIDMAVQAVKYGAFDFIEKPLSIDRVVTAVKNALSIHELKRENKRLKQSVPVENRMIGESPEFLRVREIIQQSAGTDARILITGENGTGKELVAHEIHRLSKRADAAFVEVNCAAIPDTLIESELFGHEKGSFTDAVARRKGKFELANGGTIFLDEIADMSLHAQAKVLRVIQEMRFERVGGESTMSVDVRVIAATNKDIRAEIKAGKFREDLYFRLNVIPVHVPPLRSRTEDIGPLSAYFLESGAPRGTQPKTLSGDALAVLSAHSWPGNVRELKNLMERISVMSDEAEISGETVRYFISKRREIETGEPEKAAATPSFWGEFTSMRLQDARDEFEKGLIVEKLKMCGNNISRAAESLGVYPSNLHAKLKKYAIQVEK